MFNEAVLKNLLNTKTHKKHPHNHKYSPISLQINGNGHKYVIVA